MRFYYLFITAFILANTAAAQLSKTHYIPPFYIHNESSVEAREQVIYLSTPHVTANYTITDGSGNVLKTGVVQNGVFDTYSMDGYGTAFAADFNELNVVLNNKGIIITSDSAIYANLRVNAGNSFQQGGSLTSKGISALGTNYRLGHIPSIASHGRKCAGYSIMATQNNTIVTINFKQKNLLFHGAGAPSSSTPLTVNLNAGECYVAAIHSEDSPNNLDTGLIGTQITANLPVAVNTGSWAGSLINNSGADIGIDQIVDLSLVGNKYALVRGQGIGADDDDMEQVLVVAQSNNTQIFLNGNTTAIDTIQAGEYSLVNGSNYVNEVMYIETNEDVFIYQIILGGDNTTNTQGMNFVPPITCYTSQVINSIPSIEKIGSQTYSGGISIITKKGSTILVNGAAPLVAPIDVPGSAYEAYKILALTGDIVVETNSIALVGFFGYQGAAGYGGFYSGFDRVEFSSSIIEECPPGVLYSSSNLNGSYQWYLNDVVLNGQTNDTLSFNSNGNYYVVFTKDECKDTSSTIQILSSPDLSIGDDFILCEGTDTLIQLPENNEIKSAWFSTDSTKELLIDQAGVYWIEMTNTKGCTANDSITITASDCAVELEFPNVFTPNGDGFNDSFIPVQINNIFEPVLTIYNRWGDKIAEVTDLSQGWDGTVNGRKASSGVYFWTVNYTSVSISETLNKSRNGFVQLL